MGEGELLRVRELAKTYRRGRIEVAALRGVTFELDGGAVIAVMGRSGSGKTTLLNLVAGFDRADHGSVIVGGQRVADLSGDATTIFRRRHIGFVFQFFNLLPATTAADNVALPLLAERLGRAEIARRTMEALELVGMRHRAAHRPDELSGGELQRVAIARALVMRPPLILADEPTGNLDTATADEILTLFRIAVTERRVGLLLVTHSQSAAAFADRVLTISDGRIVDDVGPAESNTHRRICASHGGYPAEGRVQDRTTREPLASSTSRKE